MRLVVGAAGREGRAAGCVAWLLELEDCAGPVVVGALRRDSTACDAAALRSAADAELRAGLPVSAGR